jgi:4'-phosphopantetheinyl transferase EntD
MIEEILPGSVAVSATQEEAAIEDLFPEEAELVTRAVPARRSEFATGRACARTALAKLGVPPEAIPVGPKGAPQWPAGFVGSITHCEGYRAAAVARSTDLITIGIDAEPNKPLPARLLADIALPPEREVVRGLAFGAAEVNWDRLLFCIKESVYKAWFPLTESWLGFEDATVSIDRSRASFAARLLVPAPTVEGREMSVFEGRWLARDGLLLAAIAVCHSRI